MQNLGLFVGAEEPRDDRWVTQVFGVVAVFDRVKSALPGCICDKGRADVLGLTDAEAGNFVSDGTLEVFGHFGLHARPRCHIARDRIAVPLFAQVGTPVGGVSSIKPVHGVWEKSCKLRSLLIGAPSPHGEREAFVSY